MRQPSESWRPLRVEAALGSPSAPPVWQDVSALVKGDDGVSIVRGGRERRSKVSPGRAQFTLDNRDGAFSGALYRRRFRVAYRHPVAANMVDAESAAFEGGTVGGWTASSGATVASSTARAASGTRSLLVTWPDVAANGASATWFGTPRLVVGRRYTVFARVWVPAGSPPVRLAFISQIFPYYGAASSVTGAWQRVSATFTAPAPELIVVVRPAAAASAGSQVWVDEVLVDEADLPTQVVQRTNLATNPRLVGGLSEWGGRVRYIDPQFTRAFLTGFPSTPLNDVIDGGNPAGAFTNFIDGGQP